MLHNNIECLCRQERDGKLDAIKDYLNHKYSENAKVITIIEKLLKNVRSYAISGCDAFRNTIDQFKMNAVINSWIHLNSKIKVIQPIRDNFINALTSASDKDKIINYKIDFYINI